jgi:hypothetical protein
MATWKQPDNTDAGVIVTGVAKGRLWGVDHTGAAVWWHEATLSWRKQEAIMATKKKTKAAKSKKPAAPKRSPPAKRGR